MRRASPSRASSPPTREKLLDAAQQLMLAKGYGASTVDEICAAAALTKGSFFHYFASKEDLALAALDRFYEARIEAFRSAPFTREADPLTRLFGLVDFTAELAAHPVTGGCLIGMFSQELSDTHPEIRARCERAFAGWGAGIQHLLEEVEASGAPHPTVDTRVLSEHLIVVLEGALVLARAKRDPSVVGVHLQQFSRYVRSLFDRSFQGEVPA